MIYKIQIITPILKINLKHKLEKDREMILSPFHPTPTPKNPLTNSRKHKKYKDKIKLQASTRMWNATVHNKGST